MLPPTSPPAHSQIDTGFLHNVAARAHCNDYLWGRLTMRFHLRFQLKGGNWNRKEEIERLQFQGEMRLQLEFIFLFEVVSLCYHSSYLSALYFERKTVLKGIEASSICKKVTCSGLGNRSYQLTQPCSCRKSQDLLHLSHFTTEKEQSVDLLSPPLIQPLWQIPISGYPIALAGIAPFVVGIYFSARELSQLCCRRDTLWWKDFPLKKIICSLIFDPLL